MEEARTAVRASVSWARLQRGFVAGFLAALIFHHPTPLGIPAVFTLAFWGGVWGAIYILVHIRFPGGGSYWAAAFLFGGFFPSLAGLLIVLPFKGLPVAGAWWLKLLATTFMINGAWGVCTGLACRFIFNRAGGTGLVAGQGRRSTAF